MGNGRISYLRRAAEGSGSEPEEPTKAPSFPQTPKPVTEPEPETEPKEEPTQAPNVTNKPEPETEPKEEPKKEPTQAPSVGSTLVLTNIKNFADKFRPGL